MNSHPAQNVIPLPPDTDVDHDDTRYRALALLDVRLFDYNETHGGELQGGQVLVVNQYGEMLTLDLPDVGFPTLKAVK